MPRSSHNQPTSMLDDVDRQLRELPREHGQIINLDAFRRHLKNASGRSNVRLADTQATDADIQLRDELTLAFADLGGAAFALAHHGALNDKRLAPHVQRIHELFAQLDAPTAAHPA